MEKTFYSLPESLHAGIIAENDEFKVLVLEVDELGSFVGNKKNDQWLWMVMHAETRRILAFDVGNRTKASREALMAKLPIDLKKSTLLYRYILSLF